MAKKNIKSDYSGPSATLVEGAGDVFGSQNKSLGAIDFSQATGSLSGGIQAAKNKARAEREAAQNEANEAYSTLSSINFEGILPGMYDGVQQSLMPIAQEIAELKLEASQISDPEERALINSQINQRDALIKRFVTQVKDLSTSALDQLDYNRSDDRSEANDENYVSSINKIFSGQAEPLMINGELAFNINGETQLYSSLKNISPKAYDEFTNYSDSVGAATSAREPISQERADAFKSKMFSTITPDNIVSFGMDNFGTGKRLLGDQFETIQDWQAFVEKDYNTAKQLLADRLAENYINTYNNSAAEYKRKNPPQGDGKDINIRKNQYLNTDAQRLFQAISGSEGQAFAIETGDNFILPNNPAGAKYKVSWGTNQVTFNATSGRKLIDPITGRQATSTTISLPELANFYGIDYSGANFPGQIQSTDAESTILNPEAAQKINQPKPQF